MALFCCAKGDKMAKKMYKSVDNYVNGKLVSGGKKKAATKKTTAKKPAAKTTTTTKQTSTPLTYAPPQYSDSYRQGIDTSAYDNQYRMFQEQAEKNRTAQLGQAQATQQNALKQAYVNRAQNQLALNNNLATAGIRGGATETANLNLANQYGTAVNAANTDYTNSVNSINQSVDQSLADYKMDVESRREQYLQDQANARWQAAREDYANRINIQREDKDNAYQRKAAETQRQTEYWSNYYINKYSGYSEKQVKKEEKTIKANLKKAKTPYEKIRWQQALAGIGARRGVIKNK